MKIKIITIILLLFYCHLNGQKKLIDLEKTNDYTTYNYPVTEIKAEDVIVLAVKDKDWENIKKVNAYKYVQELRFEKCEIKELMIDLEQFPLLQSLYISECRFDTIQFKGNPINFKQLLLYDKHLNSYNFLKQIGNVQQICLSDPQAFNLTNLTQNLLTLKKLNYLHLYGGNIVQLPDEFAQLKTLKDLGFSYMDSLFDFGHTFNLIKDMELESLNLMYNFKNPVLSSNVKLLKKIKSLYLGNTSFETLPEEIGELTQLIELNVSMGSLSTLPNSIIKLVNLKKLMLMPCKFTSIPEILFQMTWLQELEVGGEEWFPNKEELKPIRKALKKTKVNDYPE